MGLKAIKKSFVSDSTVSTHVDEWVCAVGETVYTVHANNVIYTKNHSPWWMRSFSLTDY